MKAKEVGNNFKNGVVYYPIPPVVIASYEEKATQIKRGLNFLKNIVPSAIPYLAFLILYGLNERLGLLLRFQDVAKSNFYVYNVSSIEYSLLHFSPHKIISARHFRVLDFLAAVPYLLHYVIPVLYPAYLIFKGQTNDIKKFYWLLGWVLWIQYFMWWVFPTAPQWFYDNLELYKSSPPPPLQDQHKEGCAFHRIDDFTGGSFFFKLFNGNPIPFGAFPSGHVIWPFCIFMINPPFGKFFVCYVLWVGWATLYSCHHYLSDAIAAVLLVLIVKKVIVFLQERLANVKDDTFCVRSSCLQVVSTNACPFGMV